MNKKDILVHLNFDDFNPQSDKNGDFGGLGGDNLNKIEELLKEFPNLKITMFTVPNWIDRPYKYHRYLYKAKELLRIFPVVSPSCSEPNLLRKHGDWCSLVRKLVAEDRLEIAVHGFFHFNPQSRIHGQEFEGLSESAVRQRIVLAEEEFHHNNIPFIKAFRSPGWGKNIHLTKVLGELGYSVNAYLSSSSKTYQATKESHNLLSLPQNWSIKESAEEAINLADQHGCVFMKGHIAFRYGRETVENGINDKHWGNLREALSRLEQLYTVKYITIKDIITHQK